MAPVPPSGAIRRLVVLGTVAHAMIFGGPAWADDTPALMAGPKSPQTSGRAVQPPVPTGTSAAMEFRPVLAIGLAEPPVPAPADPTAADPYRPTMPASPSDAAYYVTAEVQQEFDELDCTVPENRTGRVGKADEAFVTCSADPEQPYKYILGPVEVEGTRIARAGSSPEQLSGGEGTRWVVSLELDSKGTSEFAAVSKRLLNLPSPQNQFGIVLDGLVVSAPSINAEILNGKAEISGSFDRESAASLARQLTGEDFADEGGDGHRSEASGVSAGSVLVVSSLSSVACWSWGW